MAGGDHTDGEHRFPASFAIGLSVLLGLLLPENLTLGPSIMTPIAVGAILVPLTLHAPRRAMREAGWLRAASLVLLGVIALSNTASLAYLIEHLVTGKASGTSLLQAALIIWFQNVIVFAVVYWELDGGGPHVRAGGGDDLRRDFLFPQFDVTAAAPPGWRPTFIDYLYISFTNASAFSPTDTMPLTHPAKLLMLAQSLPSLATIVLVTARAVNIIH